MLERLGMVGSLHTVAIKADGVVWRPYCLWQVLFLYCYSTESWRTSYSSVRKGKQQISISSLNNFLLWLGMSKVNIYDFRYSQSMISWMILSWPLCFVSWQILHIYHSSVLWYTRSLRGELPSPGSDKVKNYYYCLYNFCFNWSQVYEWYCIMFSQTNTISKLSDVLWI